MTLPGDRQGMVLAPVDKRVPMTSHKQSEHIRHEWLNLRIGRICIVCRCVQVIGRFDDAVSCRAEDLAS